MKYKIGDKVEIVKALGKYPGEYMFGGTTGDVKIGQIGVIHEIYSDTITIRIKNNDNRIVTWNVSKNEIELCPKRISDLLEELE